MTFLWVACSRKGISSILIIQKNNTREHCLSTIQPSEAIAQPPLEGPARGDPARESGARAPVAGAMSHSPPGGEQGNIERRALAGEPVGNAQQIERHGAEPIVFAVPGPQESTVEALDLEIWSILPAVASPSGATAARSPSSESPDALGDTCPVPRLLTCQELDSLVAKCQARAAVTAQMGCKFPQKEQSRPKLTPPVVAGLEDLVQSCVRGKGGK